MEIKKDWLKAISETKYFLQGFVTERPKVGIVLGTGLGALIDYISITHSVPYNEIPNFPTATVEFHKGNLVFGKIGETEVIAMQGRFHFYEGYSMQEITFPIRILHALGVQNLLLSNAAGGINPTFKKGDLVLLDDHINLQPDNPLRGMTDPSFGSRFPDMSQPYNLDLTKILLEKAQNNGIELKKGVYASVIGPNLETRAEYRSLRANGADMVGMSTVPEVIVANQIGLPCAVVSVITDECDPENLKPVDISEIIAVAGKADAKLSLLFAEVIKTLA